MALGKTLKPGVSRFTRSQTFSRRKLYDKAPLTTAKTATTKEHTKKVSVKGPKNGGSRLVPTAKAPKYYPADDVPAQRVTRKTQRPAKLRQSLQTPGTVLILLSGRFAGKRVVLLKALDSGLLLVSGPHKINGVPLRRVSPAYVIATSVKVPVEGLALDKFNDEYFKREAVKGKKEATEEALFDGKTKKPVAAHRIADQKTVDATLLKSIKTVPSLKAYLNASFVLSKGQFPHQMKF